MQALKDVLLQHLESELIIYLRNGSMLRVVPVAFDPIRWKLEVGIVSDDEVVVFHGQIALEAITTIYYDKQCIWQDTAMFDRTQAIQRETPTKTTVVEHKSKWAIVHGRFSHIDGVEFPHKLSKCTCGAIYDEHCTCTPECVACGCNEGHLEMLPSCPGYVLTQDQKSDIESHKVISMREVYYRRMKKLTNQSQ